MRVTSEGQAGARTFDGREWAEDAELARAASENDSAAWTLIYERHYDQVYRYVRARVGSGSAEDVSAEVFASAVRSIGGYSRNRPLLAWLYGIAKHRVADHFRKTRRRESTVERLWQAVPTRFDRVEDGFVVEALGSRADDPGFRIELLDLRPALERLTRDQREVLVLRHLVGLSTSEIASVMNRRAASVYSLEARALARIRRYLQ